MGLPADSYAAPVERWVDERPDALAVIGDDGRVLTYAQLEEAANRVANAILDADPAGAFQTVVLGLDQGIDAIVAMLAVAKTGRTQVPLDPGDPPARLAEILSRLAPALIVLQGQHEPAFQLVPPDRRRLLRLDDIPDDAPAERRPRTIEPDTPCVVIFTSGTTGVPQEGFRTYLGIAEIHSREDREWMAAGVRHAAVADHQWLAGWTAPRKCLSSGGTIVHYSTRQRGPGELARFLADHKVQHLSAVPSLVRAMLDSDPSTPLPDLRWVSFAGDILHRDLVMTLFDRIAPDAVLSTGYGASELGAVSHLDMTRDTVPDGDIVPTGFINDRCEVEIEDPDAEGVGRLIITSRRGGTAYAGNAGRDDSVERLEDGRWRHRTSDLGRFRPDGMLEIRGRRPHMAKVRGQRVGVSEVEAALLQVPGVSDAGVGIHPEDPSGRLTAWFVPAAGAELSVTTLRRELRPRLPAFMVPAVFMPMTALPRGTRGKLLRDQLPVPGTGRPDLGYPYEAPAGDIEETVAGAFGRVLGIDEVGRHDELFDLGGDSLQAAEVMTAIAAALGRDLPLSVFLEAATPAQLAERLANPSDEMEQSRLVELQSGGDRPPVYCVHGGGGQVLSLAGLAERMEHRPFIGIQMAQRDRPRALFNLNHVAERYADAIAERQGSAPCVIAGHSYGGVVAQEVSRRLIARGVPVELCILLDASMPRRRAIAGRHRRQRALGEQDNTSAVKEVLYAVHAATGLSPKPHRLTTERMIAALWGMSWHKVQATPAPIVVMRAAGDPSRTDFQRWLPHTGGGLTVVDVPGGHNSMLAPPYVDDLARSITEHLAKVEESLTTVGS